MKMFRSSTSATGGASVEPVIAFDVVDGHRRPTRLRVSATGCTIGKDKYGRHDIVDVVQSGDAPGRLVVSVVRRIELDADDDGQVQRILDAFQGLNLIQRRDERRPDDLREPAHAPPTEASMSDFTAIGVLGEGGFGQVQLVKRNADGRLLAMKLDKDGRGALSDAERAILERIRHPFIISLVTTVVDPAGRRHLCLEYADQHDLHYHLQRLGPLPEDAVAFVTAEIILALEHLHQHDIVYRDLKPENVLIGGDYHIRLADLGLGKQGVTSPGGLSSQGTKATTFCGTPAYQPPEMLCGDDYGHACDYWSLGVLVFELLTGRVPFHAPTRLQMYENAIRAEVVFPRSVSRCAQSFIRGLLVRRPEDRMGSGPLRGFELRSHPFLGAVHPHWADLEQGRIASPLGNLLHRDALQAFIGQVERANRHTIADPSAVYSGAVPLQIG